MSNWIERLKEEKSELEVRIKSLDEFMISSAYQELDLTEKYLVGEQSDLMENYLSLIRDRVQRAGAKNCQIDLNSMFLDGIDKSLIEHYYKTEAPKEEYVTSSTANADNVNKAKSILEDAIKEHLESGDGFVVWWNREGSGINPSLYPDTESAMKHTSSIAWSNGAYTRECAIKEKARKDMLDQIAEQSKEGWVLDEEKRAFNGIFNQVTERAKEMFPEDLNESKDDITQLEITPKALLDLGFEEQYQREEMGNVGYIYYTLHLLGMELCSSVIGDDEPFHVVAGDEGEFVIHNLRKLRDLILSLKELS